MNSQLKSGVSGFCRALLICLGMASALLASSASAQRIVLDKIIAIVDDDVVLQSELFDRMRDIRESAVRANQELPAEAELRGEVLESLILENIQLQLAERVSIRYDDDTLNRVLADMATNSGMEFNEYIANLEEIGVYLQTRENVRKQLTIQELQRGMVNQRTAVTEQEIENFLNSEMGKEIMAADYLVNHILIPTADSDSNSQKESKLAFAADLVARIEEGEDFLATRSAAQQARIFPVDGTNFGWRKANQLPRIFSEVVETMNMGDVQGPIPAGNGYHIIQLAEKRGGTEQLVDQTNVRHIMLTPNEIRNEEETLEEIREFRQQIIDGANFATIARQNSDDPSSVVAGGDMDWISSGAVPPEMEQVLDALEIGEISEPFRTDLGWHIAEVLERRTTDLSREYTQSQAANALRNRKFDLELQNWLLEIREEAFVELVE